MRVRTSSTTVPTVPEGILDIYDDADIPDTTEVEPQWIKNTENKMG